MGSIGGGCLQMQLASTFLLAIHTLAPDSAPNLTVYFKGLYAAEKIPN
jgi:hypothetical protein